MAARAYHASTTVEQPGGQPAGSQALMADGTWQEIQRIAVGDRVLSPQPDGTVLTAAGELFEEKEALRCHETPIMP
jgi:hypothetical protein